MKILLVEDDTGVASFVKKGLDEAGFAIEVARDGLEGKRMARDKVFDIIILDVMLPKFSGLEVCADIRKHSKEVSILMLTALGTLDDKVTGLDAGADDYLLKPFHFKELLARLKALSRRNRHGMVECQQIGDLFMNRNKHIVLRAGREIQLTVKEYALLELFMNNCDRILSRTEIAERVWGIHFDTGTNVVDVYVNYLRNKIEKGFDKRLLHTVVGRGYVMKEP